MGGREHACHRRPRRRQGSCNSHGQKGVNERVRRQACSTVLAKGREEKSGEVVAVCVCAGSGEAGVPAAGSSRPTLEEAGSSPVPVPVQSTCPCLSCPFLGAKREREMRDSAGVFCTRRMRGVLSIGTVFVSRWGKGKPEGKTRHATVGVCY